MKHDHKKTSKLKVCLFTIVMLLPCFAVGITCLTHVFNKEVAEETETATINYMYETNEINTTNDFVNGNIYKLTIYNLSDDFGFLKTTNINWITNWNNFEIWYDTLEDYSLSNSVSITYNAYQGGHYLINHNYNEPYETSITTFVLTGLLDESTTIECTFVYSNTTNFPNNYQLNNEQHKIEQCPIEYIPIESVTITTNPQDQTTNIFYDSCEQVEESFILNWCNSANPIRTPIEQFTNAFSLPSNHIINTLITYWLCIAMIYIVIDIIVECVIMITHFFNKEF